MAKHLRSAAPGHGTPRRDAAGGRLALTALAVGALLVIVVIVFVLRMHGVPSSGHVEKDDQAPAQHSVQVSDGGAQGSVPDGDLKPESYKTELARMFAQGEVGSVRVIGDSVTAGYLTDGYDEDAVTDTVVYTGALGTYVETPTDVGCWTNDFRDYALSHGATSFVNAGICGFRMEFLAQDPDAWLADGADVIVVMLGTNDAAKESVSDFEGYARTALDAAAAKCRLLVVVSPPNNERTDAVNLYGMEQIDAVLTKVCDEKSYLHISQLDALAVGTDDFNDDQVHPTSKGSHKLWKSFAEQLGLD